MGSLEFLFVDILQQQALLSPPRRLSDYPAIVQEEASVLLAPTDHFTPVFLLEQPLSAQAVPDEFNQDGIDVEELIDEIVDDDDDDDSPFPYAFLEGEVIFEASGVSGRDLSDSVVFQSSAELAFSFSFTGEDILVVGLEAGQAGDFSFVEDITFEGQLDGASDTDDSVFELGDLIYAWPLGARAALYISATGDDIEDFNPFVGDDALSDFGAENPIHELLGDFGLQLNYEIIDDLELGIGYFSEDGSDPEAGLFRGNYGAFAQLGFEPSDEFLLGLTYIYTNNDSSLETETGTLRSQIDLERPVIGNSYGIAASFAPSDRFAIGGWAGYTSARVLGLGDADVWNYAVTLAFPDLGKEGNLLGFIVGQEPRLTGTSGFTIDDQRRDRDTSLHLELFYSNRVSDQVSITPGVIWITAPNGDRANPDILLFTVRTTFEF